MNPRWLTGGVMWLALIGGAVLPATHASMQCCQGQSITAGLPGEQG